MKLIASALVVSLLAAPPLVTKMLRPTNSAAAAKRGVAAYKKGDYNKAAAELENAARLDPSKRSSFNAGTAESAAGRFADAQKNLSAAANDPQLREPALYNRGTGELTQKEYAKAIGDFAAALRVNPLDRDAKRNLEIALQRRQQQQQQQQQQQKSGASGNNQQQQQSQSSGQKPQQQNGAMSGQTNVEQLLRSVEQQEKEELSRMRRGKGEPKRIGW